MEGPHGQLGSRLANRLGGYDANRLADIDGRSARQIAAIASAANTGFGLAGQHRADLDHFDIGYAEHFTGGLIEQRILRNDHLARFRGDHVLGNRAAKNPVRQRQDSLAALDNRIAMDEIIGAAVFDGDDAILRHIDQPAGQVAGVRRLQSGIGQTLAGAVSRIEIFEHRQAFFKVGNDRRLDYLAGRLGHQTAHAGKLLHLRRRATGAGIGHHEDRIDRLARFDLGNLGHHGVGHLIGTGRPGIDGFVVFLAKGDQAILILALEAFDHGFGGIDQLLLFLGHHEIVLAEGNAGPAGMFEAQAHDMIGEDHRLFLATMAVDLVEHRRDFLFGHQLVDQPKSQARMNRQQFAKQHAARRGFHPLRGLGAVFLQFRDAAHDLGVNGYRATAQRLFDLVDIGEGHALARLAVAHQRHIIETENDILRGDDNRLAVGRAQDVVGRHHQNPGFQLRFQRQRHVNRHLIAIEIGVEGGADQWMQLNRLAFDQHRLERLDAETVQGRRAVEEHRMFADDLFQNVPNLGPFFFDHALGGLDGGRHAVFFQARIDKRFEQFQRHFLWQTALMQ